MLRTYESTKYSESRVLKTILLILISIPSTSMYFCACATTKEQNIMLDTQRNINTEQYPNYFRSFLKNKIYHLTSTKNSHPCINEYVNQFSENKVFQLLNANFDKYEDLSSRINEPEKYIEALDQIIANSEYNFLLECRNQWKSTDGKTFEVIFKTDSNKSHEMYLQGTNNLQLFIDLHSSFQRVLFAYMHELLHVCQQPLKQSLEMSTSIDRKIRYDQFRFLMEIEAQAMMIIAFRDFAHLSSKVCKDEKATLIKKEPSLKYLYSEGEKEILTGIFPQRVISWYKENYHRMYNSLFTNSLPNNSYEKSALGPHFQLKCLHPNIVTSLQMSGLIIKQSRECP